MSRTVRPFMVGLAVLFSFASVAAGAPGGGGALPPDEAYVVSRGGDLYVGDARVRFWGAIGGFPAAKAPGEDPYAWNRRLVARLEALGFNMVRIWSLSRTIARQPEGYATGDGSPLDVHDKCVALFKDAGFRLWVGSAGSGGIATADDVGVLDDPGTADAWRAAVAEMSRPDHRTGLEGVRTAHCVAVAWDPRLEAIQIRNNARTLSHVNQHTGLRVADDPVFGIWELTNEQWWIVQMVTGKWQTLPAFFGESLLARWHAYLKETYGTDEALSEAWRGLLPGESLEAGTVLLTPLRKEAPVGALNDANPHAAAKVAGGAEVAYGRDDVSVHRGRDVNAFFAGLIRDHKQRVADAFKQCGKAARLSPLLWDAGIGYNGICQWLHQQADAVSHCAYIGGWTPDASHKRYPWFSGLEEPPRICMGVPWLEHNTAEDKPYFVYETQIGAPAKYRAEFPYRMLFLASLQDWDAVCWHTMSGGYKWDREDPFEGTLARPGHAAYQFTYLYDEVQLSAMHAAGTMFTQRHFDPAPKPTVFTYGRDTVFHPDSMAYGGSYGRIGEDMLHTAYRYGSRIHIDLGRANDAVDGPTVRLRGWAHPTPVRPTDQMVYDWQRGCLTLDAPGAVAFVGFLSQYGSDNVRFRSGVTLRDVGVASPPHMAYPVTNEERYVAIGLASTDGKPLGRCRGAVLSAVSTSCNSGLEVGPDPSVERPRHAWEGMKVVKKGDLPVQVTRVGCTVASPHLAGMRYRLRDWHWKVLGEGTVGEDGVLTVEADQPVFLVELER